MAKGKFSSKQNDVVTQKGQGRHIEHSGEFDDSLLPAPEELEKYRQVYPELIPWLMERTAKEQDARHEWTRKSQELAAKNSGRLFRVDRMVIYCAFGVITIIGALSAFLIYNDRVIESTIFSGITGLVAMKMFLDFRKRSVKQNPTGNTGS